MSEDTPGGRLAHWLGAAGIADPSQYGFHSLRAGAATDAHRNGTAEDLIVGIIEQLSGESLDATLNGGE
jgi:integrase